MIIETTSNLYRSIIRRWIKEHINNQGMLSFSEFLKPYSGNVCRKKSYSFPTYPPDVAGIVVGNDYIKFTNQKLYLLFLLKYL